MEQRYELPVSSPHSEDNEDCLGLRGCRHYFGYGALLRAGPPRLYLRSALTIESLGARVAHHFEENIGRYFYRAARKHALFAFLLLVT